MRRAALILVAALAAVVGRAQEPLTPTPEQAGTAKGDNTGDYNVVDSVETGYRFATVGGSIDNYRANVNYGDGIRLFSGFLSVNSKDGHGALFDQITLSASGLGNDPYESANLRIQKNGLYDYDMDWRLNDYFDPGLVTGGAAGANLMDTRYTLQNHDLTLFPQSNVKFFLGYTRSFQDGSGFLGVSAPAVSGLSLPLEGNIRREQDDYRIGNEFKIFGFRVNWLRGWEDFKEDSPYALSPAAGAAAGALYNQTGPYHGTSPYWQVAIFNDGKLYSLSGRFTYTSGQRAFAVDDSAFGLGRFGLASVETVTQGNAQRPVATGSFNASFFPTKKITVTNTTSVYNIRTEGYSTFLQVSPSQPGGTYTSFQYLGIRLVDNETDVNYQVRNWIAFYAGYHFTDRTIASVLAATLPAYSQDNQLNAGVAGARLRFQNGLTVTLDGEVGRANRPFTPQSDANYHTLGGQAMYRHKSLSLNVASRADYNFNTTSLTAYSMHSRVYSAGGGWTPKAWLSFDATYSKNHLDALGGIAYFVGSFTPLVQQSLFISNLNTLTLDARFALTKRVDLFIIYSRVQDTGDGRSSPTAGTASAMLPALLAAETFPVSYQAPSARLSIRLNKRLRWNAGYEYYAYQDKFYLYNNYRASTGYSSLSWSF